MVRLHHQLLLPYVSGSWEDYWNSGSIDLTGSYLAPFITTIGLYNNENEMMQLSYQNQLRTYLTIQ